MTNPTRPVAGGFRIRQATPADCEAIARMKVTAWRQAYGDLFGEQVYADQQEQVPVTASYWEQRMAIGHYFWVVLAEGERVVGVATAEAPRDADAPQPLELSMIYLLDEAKGSGIADRLLQMTIGDAGAYLWVLDDNPRAQAFYRRHGFVADGESRSLGDYYNDHREIRMVRPMAD